MKLGSCIPRRTLTNGLRLNPTVLSNLSIHCVTSMMYFVYLITQALRSDGYRLSSDSKEIIWSRPKYISCIKLEK